MEAGLIATPLIVKLPDGFTEACIAEPVACCSTNEGNDPTGIAPFGLGTCGKDIEGAGAVPFGLGTGGKDIEGAGAVENEICEDETQPVNVPFGLGTGGKDIEGAGAVNVPFGLRAMMVHTNFKPRTPGKGGRELLRQVH